MKFFLTQSDYKICLKSYSNSYMLIIVDKNGQSLNVSLDNNELIALNKLCQETINDKAVI